MVGGQRARAAGGTRAVGPGQEPDGVGAQVAPLEVLSPEGRRWHEGVSEDARPAGQRDRVEGQEAEPTLQLAQRHRPVRLAGDGVGWWAEAVQKVPQRPAGE